MDLNFLVPRTSKLVALHGTCREKMTGHLLTVEQGTGLSTKTFMAQTHGNIALWVEVPATWKYAFDCTVLV